MARKYVVYKHTAPNGKVYIGITAQKPSKRWNSGLGYKHQRVFYNAIKKYGWDNFKHEILFENLTKEDAESKEIELIANYKSTNRNYGYNCSTGGDCGAIGVVISESTKKKMSEAHKGKIRSREYRKHISESKKGAKNGMYGVKGAAHPNSKKIRAYDLNGNIVGEFACMREATDKLNLPEQGFKNISACVHGRKKTAYGYIRRACE